jgi:quinol-cytochrome oxidoreductase complex cytochrome b subunit
MSAGSLPVVGFVRDLHRLASDALVVVVFLHMARVFLTGALGPRRRLNWLVGVGLLLLVLATAFTGFLLPWDRDAYWAATVGGELIGLLPGLGSWLRGIMWGGDRVSEDTVLRAYALHVAALPCLGTVLAAYHLWRIRKAGGLARPDGKEKAGALVATRPTLTIRELALALLSMAVLFAIALFWDAPLGIPGHPPRPLDPAKAPWFFLWVQELVSYSTTLGGVVPLLLVALLGIAPLAEKHPESAGSWFVRERRGRCLLFVATSLALIALIVVAAWLRGPGWQLSLP